MPEVRPFTGYLFDPDVAGPLQEVTAPPYDTISPVDRDRYHRASPHNVIRLILGKDEPGDDGKNNKYTRASIYLRKWVEQGVLHPIGPAVYPYAMRFHLGGRPRVLRGVIVEVDLEPWGGSILGHERTMPGPVEDRLHLLREVRANLSAVYGVVPGPAPAMGEVIDAAMKAPPVGEVVDEAGTLHQMWVSTNGTEALSAELRASTLMIADGHHRYTVALAYREEMRRRHGGGPWDSTMMLLVDGATEDPPVLPIHRAVMDGPAPDADGEIVRDMAEVLASLNDDQLVYGSVRMEEGEPVHRVASLRGSPPTVCAIHEAILDSLPAATLRFVPDVVAAEGLVLSGEASIAYILPATDVGKVRGVIRSGRMLPQKSTYFWPKPRTGLVIRPHLVS